MQQKNDHFQTQPVAFLNAWAPYVIPFIIIFSGAVYIMSPQTFSGLRLAQKETAPHPSSIFSPTTVPSLLPVTSLAASPTLQPTPSPTLSPIPTPSSSPTPAPTSSPSPIPTPSPDASPSGI